MIKLFIIEFNDYINIIFTYYVKMHKNFLKNEKKQGENIKKSN